MTQRQRREHLHQIFPVCGDASGIRIFDGFELLEEAPDRRFIAKEHGLPSIGWLYPSAQPRYQAGYCLLDRPHPRFVWHDRGLVQCNERCCIRSLKAIDVGQSSAETYQSRAARNPRSGRPKKRSSKLLRDRPACPPTPNQNRRILSVLQRPSRPSDRLLDPEALAMVRQVDLVRRRNSDLLHAAVLQYCLGLLGQFGRPEKRAFLVEWSSARRRRRRRGGRRGGSRCRRRGVPRRSRSRPRASYGSRVAGRGR